MVFGNVKFLAMSGLYIGLGFGAPYLASMISSDANFSALIGVFDMFGVISCAFSLFILGAGLNRPVDSDEDGALHAK